MCYTTYHTELTVKYGLQEMPFEGLHAKPKCVFQFFLDNWNMGHYSLNLSLLCGCE